MVIISGITPNIINSIDPAKIGVFPNYLWVYLHHHITFQVLGTCGIAIFLLKHEPMRKNAKKKFKAFLDCFLLPVTLLGQKCTGSTTIVPS